MLNNIKIKSKTTEIPTHSAVYPFLQSLKEPLNPFNSQRINAPKSSI